MGGIEFFIYAGAGIALTFAINQVRRPLTTDMIIGFLFFFSVFVWQGYAGILHGAHHDLLRYVFTWDIPMAFCTGPCMYYYFIRISGLTPKMRWPHILHIVPATISIPLLIAISPRYPVEGNAVVAMNLLSTLSAGGYTILLLIRFSNLLRERKSLGAIKWPVIIVYSSALPIVLGALENDFFAVAFLRKNAVSSLVVTLVLYLMLSFSLRYPDAFSKLREELERVTYARSRIDNLDSEVVQNQLLDLFTHQKIFLQQNLTLNETASKLKIRPHQLTQILNQKIGKNFNGFLNSYRIAESVRILRSNPDLTTLRAALESGYKSYSVFHSAFVKEMKQSPSEFLKSIRG